MAQKNDVINARLDALENKKPATPVVQGEIDTSDLANADDFNNLKDDFDKFKIMVIEYHNKNDEDKNDLKAAKENHNQRLNDLENQLELLKKMGAPSGGSSDGLLDVLNDITDKLRKELQDKLDDLSKRIEEVDKDSKDRDATQEDRMKNMLDIQNDNIKRLDDLDLQCGALSDEKADKNDFLNEIRRLEDIIEGLGSGKPVEIRAASPKGPKVTEDDIDKWNKAAKIAD